MYRSQGNIWSKVEVLSSQSCYLEFLYIFKRNSAYLYPHRFSQVTHYLLYISLRFFYFAKILKHTYLAFIA